MTKPTKIGIYALTALAVGSSGIAHAANPGTAYATKVAALHAAQHPYPSDARITAGCSGYAPYREMRCKVTVSSAQLLNGGEVYRYVATGRIVRSGRNWRVINFKAYAVGGIA